MTKRIISTLFLLFTVSNYIFAQQIPNAEMLRSQGVSEEQIKMIEQYKSNTNRQDNIINKEQPLAKEVKKELETSEVDKASDVSEKQTKTENLTKSKNLNKGLVKESLKGEDKKKEVVIDTVTPAKVYGQGLFRDGKINFYEDPKDIRPSDEYILGEGDELTINIWGSSEFTGSYIIKSGAIQPNLVGRIYLKGMTYGKAKELIKSRFSQVYYVKNNSIDVTLNYSRQIIVNIVGEVVKPGSYSMPAINTALNALGAAKGITDFGSVRNIQIKREGKTVKTIDLYEYLFNPKYDANFYLESNDYIYVPILGKTSDIQGEVLRKGWYELKENEGLKKLLEYAGGQLENGFNIVEINRFVENRNTIINANTKSDFLLQKGDVVWVKKNSNEIEEKITINGSVIAPGEYEYKRNEKISDIIKKSGGVKLNTNKEIGFVFRKLKDGSKGLIIFSPAKITENYNSIENIEIKNNDEILLLNSNLYSDKYKVLVKGAVLRQDTLNFAMNMTLKDALLMCGGITKEADINRIEISRISNFSPENIDKSVKTTVQNIILSVNRDMNEDTITGKFYLQPFDMITVRNTPEFSNIRLVTIRGEVNYPGEYAIKDNSEKISSLIERAGGYTPHAFLEGATFERVIDNTGKVILDLNKINSDKNSLFNYSLKEGDTIFIPTKKEFISLQGAIQQNLISGRENINVPYSGNKDAEYYISEYGLGFAKDADKKRTYVILPNGKLSKTKKFFFYKKYPKVVPGSKVVAEYKQTRDRNGQEKQKKNWDDFWEKTVTRVTAALTLVLLLRTVTK